jgi:hypothetical protein
VRLSLGCTRRAQDPRPATMVSRQRGGPTELEGRTSTHRKHSFPCCCFTVYLDTADAYLSPPEACVSSEQLCKALLPSSIICHGTLVTPQLYHQALSACSSIMLYNKASQGPIKLLNEPTACQMASRLQLGTNSYGCSITLLGARAR